MPSISDATNFSFMQLLPGYPLGIKKQQEMVWNREFLLSPVLFSVSNPAKTQEKQQQQQPQQQQGEEKVRLTVQGQYCWSDPFSVNVQGVEGECVVSGAGEQARERRYSISISHAPGAFGRSRVVTITPRFILLNETDSTIKVGLE